MQLWSLLSDDFVRAGRLAGKRDLRLCDVLGLGLEAIVADHDGTGRKRRGKGQCHAGGGIAHDSPFVVAIAARIVNEYPQDGNGVIDCFQSDSADGETQYLTIEVPVVE